MNHYQLYCISQRKRQMLLRRLRIIAVEDLELLNYCCQRLRIITA
jgi:hypothetical protein